jgi:hypothetical protein
MKTSTNRGHRCARQALARLAEAELFRQFQYLTVPLHLFPDAEDLGRGAIDAIFAVAPTEQERNQEMR